jgi:cellulose synthase (UDP-forming)
LEGLQKIIFYITPPVALFTGVLPMRALDVNYLLHFIPYFVISTIGFNEMARGFGGQIMLEQYSMGKFFTYIKTFLIALLPKKSQEFEVTPKWYQERSSSALILPQMLVLFASIVAICWALVQLLVGLRGDSFIVAVNCFWALYNSGLALAIIQYDYKKLFQRRTRFRIPDTIPVFYQSNTAEKPVRHLAVADNVTEEGLSLIVIGQVPAGQKIRVDLMLPSKTLELQGEVVQERSITADQYPVSNLGILFRDVSQEMSDELSRYIHESAVSKFMKEYSTKYKTYLERRFMGKRHFHERAYRALTYLPVIVSNDIIKHTYSVIKDISETGLLMATRVSLPQGTNVTMDVILGQEKTTLKGTVVREFSHGSENYPAFLLGIHFESTYKEKVAYLLGIADKIGNFIFE